MRIPALASALAIVSLFASPFGARAEWKDMNTDVNATNFIVTPGGGGTCTGTLISLKYRLVLTANHCLTEDIKIEEKDVAAGVGGFEKVKREVYTDLKLSQKAYQGFRTLGHSESQVT